MPLYHASASMLAVAAVIEAGSSIALGHVFSTKQFWKEVRSSQATVIQYVGETCRYLLAAPPEMDPSAGTDLSKKHHVRLAYGNGMRPDVWEAFQRRFGIDTIVEFYTGTESPIVMFNFCRNEFGRGAVGRTSALVRFFTGPDRAVVEVDWETETPLRDRLTGFCRRVKEGQPGEILHRLDAVKIGDVYQGYFNDRKATDKNVLRDVFVKGDAWYRSGDVLSMDAEGRWYFHDRIGDTYRWKSENVSTTVGSLSPFKVTPIPQPGCHAHL